VLHIHSIDLSDRPNAKKPGKTIFPGRSGAIAANLVSATLFQRRAERGVPDPTSEEQIGSALVFEHERMELTMVARKNPAQKRKAQGRKPSARRTSRQATSKRWSQRVTEESDALDLPRGVFKLTSAKKIAAPLKNSAERSSRRKSGAYRSALSMLTFYINRAGKNLPKTERDRLERAKTELKRAFGREE
jgi:hypothetical protein